MADEKQATPDAGDGAADDGADIASDSPADGGQADEAEPATDEVEAAPDADRRWGGWGALTALIVLALLVVGLYLAWPVLQPRLLALVPAAATETMAAVEALDRRVAQLEAADARLDQAVAAVRSSMASVSGRLDELSQKMPGADVLAGLSEKYAALEAAMAELGQKAGAGGTAALAALTAEVDALRSRLGDLAAGPADAAPGVSGEDVDALRRQTVALAGENKELRQNLAALRTRLEQLEGSVQQTVAARRKSGVSEGLVLAVGQLRQTVLSGAPYSAPLAAVTALMGNDPELRAAAEALAPTAAAGIVTLRALSDQFPAMARAVLRAESAETGSFWRRTLRRVTSLVTVRRVGEVEGAETDAVLARAERRLAAGELAAAVGLIEGLDGPAIEAARDWLARAKARQTALAALAGLQRRAIAGLADG